MSSVAIIGSGRMGRGIAVSYAAAGRDVFLIDIKERDAIGYKTARDAAEAEIASTLAAMRKLDLLQPSRTVATVRHATADDMRHALARADVVYEAVPETLDAKAAVFAAITPLIGSDAVIASTASSFVATELAALVDRPERFLNAHWLNPAYIIPLVEVSPHPGTNRSAVERVMTTLRAVGKVPVECAAAAGYIVPRLQTLLMNEVARMTEEGVATAEAIDLAIRWGFGPRYDSMGVAEFIDFGGMDILHYASGYLARALSARFEAPKTVAWHVARKQRGARDGQGFYDWRGVDLDAYREQLLRRVTARVVLAKSEADDLRPSARAKTAEEA